MINFIMIIYLINIVILSNKEDIANINKQEDNNKDSDIMDVFSKEWSEKMLDYEATYVYMIPLVYTQSQIFYENITNVPCRVRGAFILDYLQKDAKVNFKILSPSKKIIYSNYSSASIFDLKFTEKGLYSIILENNMVKGEIKPTFTMNSGQNVIMKTKDLENTDISFDILKAFLKSINTEDKLKSNIIKERRIKLEKNMKYFFTFSLIESMILIVVSFWQFYYMKHLFEIKGSL